MSMQAILVVDDDSTVRGLTSRILVAEGFAVVEATNGAEAIERVVESGERVRLVVSDVMMPVLDGIGLLERLSVSHPEIPVILMSGYSSTELRAHGLAAPCGVLQKPFAADELIGHVRRCLAGAPV